MRAEEFLNWAGRTAPAGITAKTSDPASLRSAVSRAYYGAFHLALEALEAIECRPAEAGIHANLANILQNTGNPDAVVAGRFLADLRADRIKADYRLTDIESESPQFARLSVETAHSARDKLMLFRAACAAPAPLASIQAAIRAYCKTARIILPQDSAT